MIRRPPTRIQLKTDDIEEYDEVREHGHHFLSFISFARMSLTLNTHRFSFVFDVVSNRFQIMRERNLESGESMLSNFNKSSFSNDRSSSMRHSSGKRKKTNAERIGLPNEKR